MKKCYNCGEQASIAMGAYFFCGKCYLARLRIKGGQRVSH
jgi:Zn finger protein HypA/HybF involved in hydrogenase expression